MGTDRNAPSKKLLDEVKAFIDKNFVRELEQKPNKSGFFARSRGRHLEKRAKSTKTYTKMRSDGISASLNNRIGKLDEPFSATLRRFIISKDMIDADVWKRANIDRRLFSKINTGKGYMPSKRTVMALAIALRLSLPETRVLLERAGFTLSRSVLFDVIIECFIENGWYDIDEINSVLYEYDQLQLGG